MMKAKLVALAVLAILCLKCGEAVSVEGEGETYHDVSVAVPYVNGNANTNNFTSGDTLTAAVTSTVAIDASTAPDGVFAQVLITVFDNSYVPVSSSNSVAIVAPGTTNLINSHSWVGASPSYTVEITTAYSIAIQGAGGLEPDGTWHTGMGETLYFMELF